MFFFSVEELLKNCRGEVGRESERRGHTSTNFSTHKDQGVGNISQSGVRAQSPISMWIKDDSSLKTPWRLRRRLARWHDSIFAEASPATIFVI